MVHIILNPLGLRGGNALVLYGNNLLIDRKKLPLIRELKNLSAHQLTSSRDGRMAGTSGGPLFHKGEVSNNRSIGTQEL